MKRVISIVLVLILVLSSGIVVSAATDTATDSADKLYDLGLFYGTGTDSNGQPIYSLNKSLTRVEAITMMVRLLGKDSEAKNGVWKHPFNDVPAWASNYVGYAYSKGLTSGISANQFGSQNQATANQYMTFILRALGYQDGVDFNWSTAYVLGTELGICTNEYANKITYTRGDAVIASEKTLTTNLKNASIDLLASLEADGAVNSLAVDAYRNSNKTSSIKTSTIPTVQSGKLTVATSPDFAPYEFYAIGSDGVPYLAGFDISLAQYIANELGLELEIIPMDFDGTVMELANGDVDMSLAGYAITAERKAVMDFSIIYYGGEQSLVTTKKYANEIKDFKSANNSDYIVEAQVGSIQAELMHQYAPNATTIEMIKITDVVAELVSGRAQAAFMETTVAESFQAQYPDLVIVCDVPFDSEGSAAGITKGNTALVNAVNAAISKCISSGTFDKFVDEAQELAKGNIIEGLLN